MEASTHEVFLLGAAALANITFMDSLACDYLLHYHTASVLIEACMLNKAESLFAKDQVSMYVCVGVFLCTHTHICVLWCAFVHECTDLLFFTSSHNLHNLFIHSVR